MTGSLSRSAFAQLWDTAAKQWSELNATDAPIHRYRQSLVVHRAEGAVYLYGGESYRPYMYHNAVNRLLLPPDVRREMVAESPRGLSTRRGLRAVWSS